VCEFRRSGGAAPGINIPVGNDGGIDITIGIPIGGSPDKQCETPQCRIDRLNARVSLDYPNLPNANINPFGLGLELASELLSIINGEGFGGITVSSSQIYVNTNIDDDIILQAVIFHERLHIAVLLSQEDPIFKGLYPDYEEEILDVHLEYQTYLVDRKFFIDNPDRGHLVRTPKNLPTLDNLPFEVKPRK
jgi:hypothetical protein